MAHGKFEFKGTGMGYIWLFIWTTFLTLITFGLFVPWAVAARQRWKAAHTYIDGKQLCFKGSGTGFIVNWLLIIILSVLTLGIYLPWGLIRLQRWITNNTYFADPGDVEYLVDVKKIQGEKDLFCQNCRNKLPPDALFCDECGSKVEK